jgi:hypothetical protein
MKSTPLGCYRARSLAGKRTPAASTRAARHVVAFLSDSAQVLRGLIDSIVLMPEKGHVRIVLRGNLAAMLTPAQLYLDFRRAAA